MHQKCRNVHHLNSSATFRFGGIFKPRSLAVILPKHGAECATAERYLLNPPYGLRLKETGCLDLGVLARLTKLMWESQLTMIELTPYTLWEPQLELTLYTL